jgi:hypothetical protein
MEDENKNSALSLFKVMKSRVGRGGKVHVDMHELCRTTGLSEENAKECLADLDTKASSGRRSFVILPMSGVSLRMLFLGKSGSYNNRRRPIACGLKSPTKRSVFALRSSTTNIRFSVSNS